jgi:hypothetical protein
MIRSFTFLIFLLCLFHSYTIVAQQNAAIKQYYEDKQKHYLNKRVISSRIFDEEIMERLKRRETIFFYKNEDTSNLQQLMQVLTEAWDITPLAFDNIDAYAAYRCDTAYSCFIIEFNNDEGALSPQYYLALRLLNYCTGDSTDENRIAITDGMCRIELSPDFNTKKMTYDNVKRSTLMRTYKEGKFLNWSPVLLKAQLQAVCTDLKNNKRPNLYKHFREGNLTELLIEDTLYVPSSVLFDFNTDKKEVREKSASFFEDYRWPYRICNDEELFNIFEIEKRGRFLFEYVRSFPDKYLTVYDTREKQVIYRQHVEKSYQLKSRDIQHIK